MLWEYLFARELADETVAETMHEVAAIRAETMDRQRKAHSALEQRVARLELALTATTRLLERRAGIKPDEIALEILRLDLADGFEDGRIGPERVAAAPKCSSCGRPINPKRDACVYCNAIVRTSKDHGAGGPYRGASAPAMEGPRPAPQMATCVECAAVLPLHQTDLSVKGIVCPRCSRKLNG